MLSKLKNKKCIIIVVIVIIVISTGIGVYLYKENHDSIVMDIIVNYKNEVSKNSVVEEKEYSEEDLQNLKTKLEEVLKNVENKKSSMEILWGDYTQYDKLVENIKCEVKTIDERIIKVKKDAEQKAKEEAEKKAEEERIAKEEEERKEQEIVSSKVGQSSADNSQNNSGNSNSNSGNAGNSDGNSISSSNSNNSKPSFPWPGLTKYYYINENGERFDGYRDPSNGNVYDLNGNLLGDVDW